MYFLHLVSQDLEPVEVAVQHIGVSFSCVKTAAAGS
jgi:hypothetical protein